MNEWRVSGLYKVSADDVTKELSSLGDRFTPQQVVDLARDEKTALHSCFEWDDTVAAEKYRLTQAQTLIRMIVIHDEKKDEKTEVRMFVSTGERTNEYTPTKIIVRHLDEYQALLERAMAELRAFKKKYETLKELDYILQLIE